MPRIAKQLPTPKREEIDAPGELTPIDREELAVVNRVLRMCDEGEWGEDFGVVPPFVFEYLDWIVAPPQLREPPTRKAFCLKHGVPTQVIRDLDEHVEFQRLRMTRYRANGVSRTAVEMVMESLFQRATGPFGKAADTELFLRQTGLLKPKVDVSVESGGDLDGRTEGEILEELEKVRAKRGVNSQAIRAAGVTAVDAVNERARQAANISSLDRFGPPPDLDDPS